MSASLDESRRCLDVIEDLADDWELETRENLKKGLAALGEQEQVIRYQLNRLEAASEAAIEDLWNGLEIAWERFTRDLGLLRERVIRFCTSHAISTKQK